MDLLVKQFKAVASTCTFLGQQNCQIDANKLAEAHNIPIFTFAIFHYVVPHDTLFEYQETPQNVHRDSAPDTILVFEFTKKQPASTKLVQSRVNKFTTNLQQFCRRRSFDQLESFAKMPEVPQELRMRRKVDSLESMHELLRELAKQVRIVPARQAQYSDGPIDPNIQNIMERKGIGQLYSHQYEAIKHLENGCSIVVATSTASGKTLIFQAPVIASLEQDSDATALFIYPTKALAQDQLQIFRQSADALTCNTFDGDTPLESRDAIRDNTRVLFSNPDTLHHTILPRWSDWQQFLSELRYVVIDEVHSYVGIFGAHIALILRRLRRLCYQLGNEDIKFICCSATIHSPLSFVSLLTGLESDQLRLVDKDGSPMAQKYYYFIQSHTQDDTQYRGNPIRAAAPLFLKLLSCGLKVIAFSQYRKGCELLMKAIRHEPCDDPEILKSIMSYRGGYNPEDRRQIERDMFSNKLSGIVATSALEVGVDIGSLDAVILCGFPKSLSSFRQQIGRVGRRKSDSLVIFVAGGHVMDQTYLANPDRVFSDNDPEAVLTLEPAVIEAHLQCAAKELAMGEEDLAFFNFDGLESLLPKLDLHEGLYHSHGNWLPNPTSQVHVRNIEQDTTAIVDVTDDRNFLLENIERSRVGFTVYPGGIYIHQGLPYLVVDLDEDQVYAKVQRTTVQWTTRQRDYTDVDPLKSICQRTLCGQEDYECYIGPVKIKTVVYGYWKVDKHNRIIGDGEVTLPPVIVYSFGMWINVPARTLNVLIEKKIHTGAAIHAAEHAILNVIPQFVPLALGDVATECKAPEKEFAKKLSSRRRPARLVFYQRHAGDVARHVWMRLFQYANAIIDKVLEIVDNCDCDHGCASCVGFAYCSEKNIVLSKIGAQIIFRAMRNLPVDDLPDGPEMHLLEATEGTVVAVDVNP